MAKFINFSEKSFINLKHDVPNILHIDMDLSLDYFKYYCFQVGLINKSTFSYYIDNIKSNNNLLFKKCKQLIQF